MRRERLFDAAESLLRQRPWSEVAVDDLASAAGIPRSTFYTVHDSRQQFAAALLARERARLIEALEGAIHQHPEQPGHGAQGAFDVLVAAARRNTLGPQLLNGQECDGVSAQLAEIMHETQPALTAAQTLLLSDMLVRLALSQASDRDGTDRLSGDGVARMLGPYLEHAGGVVRPPTRRHP